MFGVLSPRSGFTCTYIQNISVIYPQKAELTRVICGRAGGLSEASQGGVVRALSHAVDGCLVTLTKPLLTPTTGILGTKEKTTNQPALSSNTHKDQT